MISLAKEGSLASRRRAIGYIYDKKLVHSLFEKAKERYGDRNGGYTRIIKLGLRDNDRASVSFIEFVDMEGTKKIKNTLVSKEIQEPE